MGTVPSAPPISAQVFVVGSGGAAVPTDHGGDEQGTWVYTNVDIYIGGALASQVDTANSSVTGTGWIAFEGDTFRQQTDINMKIATQLLGTQSLPANAKAKGTYTNTDGSMVFTSTCSAVSDPATINSLTFFRVSSTTARFVTNTSNAYGTATIVAQLSKVP